MPLLAQADVVLVLDTTVPWIPDRMSLRPDARVIAIGPDPLFAQLPVRTFPADLAIASTAAAAVEAGSRVVSGSCARRLLPGA